MNSPSKVMAMIIMLMRNSVNKLLDFLFPRSCPMCGKRLEADEQSLCISCNMSLPRLHLFDNPKENFIAKLFYGKAELDKVVSLLHFVPHSEVASIVYDMKYHGYANVGDGMGRIMAQEAMPSGFFDDIDVIVPLPISSGRRLHRGYNQSERLARGMSSVCGKPMERYAVIRKSFRSSQTNLTYVGRQENVSDTFMVVEPDRIRGKHVLLVDDVMTTGATVLSCACEILNAGCSHLSIYTLFKAGSMTEQSPEEVLKFM